MTGPAHQHGIVDDTVLAAFARRVALDGAKPAVEHDGRALSYSELDRYAADIAVRLTELGVGENHTVGLCLSHSLHAVAAMLACLKVQAVFVPLDPQNPEDRTRYMVDDAGVSSVLCTEDTHKTVAAVGLPAVVLLDDGIRFSDAHHATDTDPDARAYVMYTSGSTGQPKGVQISHRALISYCKADATVYALEASDRTLQFSTLSFDIAIEEIFPPLCTGGTVVMRPSERSEAHVELSEIVETHAISCLHIATGYWHEWVDLMAAFAQRVPASVRLMVVTGEKVSVEHYKRWRSLSDHDTLWVNAYGPTETTVSATAFVPGADWDGSDLPIGKPLPGYSAYILDAAGHDVTPGETGELLIGGPALADGYLNKSEQTQAAFVRHPHRPELPLYRTGDLARWLPSGDIAFAGRIDHQIKVGSYRVEPGEIENTLNAQPGVLESLVVPLSVDGRNRLLAYVATGPVSLDLDTLAINLRHALPDYMVPNHFVTLARFEKTVNGKVDRARLPDPATARSPKRADYVAPINATESALQTIWQAVLDVPDIGVEDSFFALGGDSLTATRVIAKMQSALGKTLSSRDFFYLETIKMMAGQLDGKSVPRIVPSPVSAFINTNGRQLYSVLQKSKPNTNRRHGVLLVPPLGNEQRRIQRPLRNVMQHFSRAGYTLMRFDWTGTGNSSGDAADLASLDPWYADLVDSAQALAEHCNQIDIVAFRVGALLASHVDFDSLPIRHTVYCEPVLNGADWLAGQERLQHDILADTYRFLRPRAVRPARLREYSGLEMGEALHTALQTARFRPRAAGADGRGTESLILPAGSATDGLVGYGLHTTDDDNVWYHHRKTNADMQLNHTARLVAELIDVPAAPGHETEQRDHAA
ncbi:MAG: amino acid adenylation domain-containing protein [Pseudomonadota bacterium]